MKEFIKHITVQQAIGDLNHVVVQEQFKESQVYNALDSINYYLTDDDRLPASLVTNSSHVDNDFMGMVVDTKSYMERSLVSAKRLTEALELEIQAANRLIEARNKELGYDRE